MNKENEKVVYGMQEKKCIHTWVFFMGMIISLGILIISRKLKPWHLVWETLTKKYLWWPKFIKGCGLYSHLESQKFKNNFLNFVYPFPFLFNPIHGVSPSPCWNLCQGIPCSAPSRCGNPQPQPQKTYNW